MNKNYIALVLGAGLALLNYRFIGRRLGYSNTKRVWVTTLAVFIVGYLIVLSALIWLVHK